MKVYTIKDQDLSVENFKNRCESICRDQKVSNDNIRGFSVNQDSGACYCDECVYPIKLQSSHKHWDFAYYPSAWPHTSTSWPFTVTTSEEKSGKCSSTTTSTLGPYPKNKLAQLTSNPVCAEYFDKCQQAQDWYNEKTQRHRCGEFWSECYRYNTLSEKWEVNRYQPCGNPNWHERLHYYGKEQHNGNYQTKGTVTKQECLSLCKDLEVPHFVYNTGESHCWCIQHWNVGSNPADIEEQSPYGYTVEYTTGKRMITQKRMSMTAHAQSP